MPHRGKRPSSPSKNNSKKPPKWNGDISTLTLLGHGTTGLVFALSRTTVAKIPLLNPHSEQALATERRIYTIFSQCETPPPNILTCLDYSSPYGLILTRCDSTLRSRLLMYATKGVPSLPAETLKWAGQASSALSFLHSHSIVHADVGCHNMMLSASSSDIQLCDFAGSALPDSPATVCYEPRSKLPDTIVPDQKSDIFALGCAFFEMETLAIPYAETPLPTVAEWYRAEKFPHTEELLLGKVVRACWKGQGGYTKVRQASEEIKRLESKQEEATATEREQKSAATTPIKTLSKRETSKSKLKNSSSDAGRSVPTPASITYVYRPRESKSSKRRGTKGKGEESEKHSRHHSGFIHDWGLRLSQYLRVR